MRKVAGSLTVLLLALASALALSLVAVTPVSASSQPNTITFDPQSGPVGTQVTVDINADVPGPTDYTLLATMTAPATDGCASGQPVPGVAPITVSTQIGEGKITWPSQLNVGPYYLCARPTSGSGPVAVSQTLFAVTGALTPTPTATAIPIGGNVEVAIPVGGVRAGAVVDVHVAHWANPQKRPMDVIFYSQDPRTPQGGSAPHYAAQFTLSGSGSSYALQVTAPSNMSSGSYWLAVGDGVGEVYSNSFSVAGAPTPAATPTAASAPAGTVQSGSAPPALLMIGIAALLVLLILAGGAIARVASQKSKSAPRPYGRPGESGAFRYDACSNQRAYEYEQHDNRSGSRYDGGEPWQHDPVRSGAHDRPRSTSQPADASWDT